VGVRGEASYPMAETAESAPACEAAATGALLRAWVRHVSGGEHAPAKPWAEGSSSTLWSGTTYDPSACSFDPSVASSSSSRRGSISSSSSRRGSISRLPSGSDVSWDATELYFSDSDISDGEAGPPSPGTWRGHVVVQGGSQQRLALPGMSEDEEDAIERLLRSEEEAESALADLHWQLISCVGRPHSLQRCAECVQPGIPDDRQVEEGQGGTACQQDLQELWAVSEKLQIADEELAALVIELRNAVEAFTASRDAGDAAEANPRIREARDLPLEPHLVLPCSPASRLEKNASLSAFETHERGLISSQ